MEVLLLYYILKKLNLFIISMNLCYNNENGKEIIKKSSFFFTLAFRHSLRNYVNCFEEETDE